MSKKNDLLEPDSMSFEQASEELDAIVKSIDEGSCEGHDSETEGPDRKSVV